ncbi:thioesterase domain-containing protein, partial [Caballeronia catudaia]
EIAQQLVAAGEKIEMLCLLDTYVHEHCLPLSQWTRHQAGLVAERLRELRSLDARGRFGYMRGKAAAITDRVRGRMGMRTGAGRQAPKPSAELAGLPPALLRVRESMRVAMTNYKPRRYDGGPIVYVRATLLDDSYGDPLPVWQRVAKHGLRVMKVEGRHTDLVVEPHLATVAQTLTNALASG